MAQTAPAPAQLRPLAPAPSNASSVPLLAQRSFAYRTPKPLVSTSDPLRPIALSQKGSSSSQDQSTPQIVITNDGKNAIKKSSAFLNSSERVNTTSTLVDAESLSRSTSREVSTTPSTSTEGPQSTTSLQPSKEWILPARAKPGRKPSETELPTKRKAQNRASQRAFRERKQSYVASLEQKIEEYERNGVEMNIELQQVVRKFKEENEKLKREIASFRSRIRELEVEKSKSREGVADVTTTQHNADSLINNRIRQSPKATVDTIADSHVIEMNRDCGFCTEGSYCVCKGEASFHTLHTDVQQANKLPVISTNMEIRNAKSKKKLWYTVLPSLTHQVSPQICPTEQPCRSSRQNTGPSASVFPAIPSKQKLWPLYSPGHTQQHHSTTNAVPIFRLQKPSPLASGSTISACTGDPSRCGACSADPPLAAFCRAVATHLLPGSTLSIPAILDAGNAMPLSSKNGQKRGDGSTDYRSEKLEMSSSHQRLTSIPEAWNRIKLHPSFPKWQGGLDLLADVVSKRSHAEDGSFNDRAQVDAESKDMTNESYSRAKMKDEEGQEAQRQVKKRRLFVEKKGVEEALAMLDRGTRPSPYMKVPLSSCECPLKHTL